jgi:hypothetical protein
MSRWAMSGKLRVFAANSKQIHRGAAHRAPCCRTLPKAVRFGAGDSDSQAAASVEAALERRVASQTLHNERGPAGWRLASAGLQTSN